MITAAHTWVKTAGILATVLLCGCENDPATVRQINARELGKDVARNVQIRYSLGSRRKAILVSPLMYRVQDTASYVEFPETLHVDFYNDRGDSIESRLDARYAKYRDAQSLVYLKDNVRVLNVLGDTLYCEELYWDRSRKGFEFYTDKPVRIRRRFQIIDGTGMEARQDFREWHILHPAGFVQVPAAEFPN